MRWLFKKKVDSNIVNNETQNINNDNKIVVENNEELTDKKDIQEMKKNCEQQIGNIQIKKKYMLPSLNLLKTYKKDINIQNELLNNIVIIENTLSSFKINAKVIEVNIGSRYTNYELELNSGTKYNSVSTLHKEIALALIIDRVIISPSKKNKNTVSIAVPNRKLNILGLKETLILCEKKLDNNELSIVLGEDIHGKIVSADIREMPNLLISGSTGSGKSVCVNVIICSILMRARPDEVKLVMVDSKVVDLSVYNGLPHLLCPVVTDPKKASVVLSKMVMETEKRYQVFSDSHTKNIEEYNEYVEDWNNKHPDDQKERMPFIVIIIDELADLKITPSEDIEESISIIAQLARNVGVHLIITTQRPSSDIITNSIKSNIPARIALSVPSSLDSRIILDENGAEDLCGGGEMLVKIKKGEPTIRVQGCYISNEEINKIVCHCISQTEPIYDEKEIHDKSIVNHDDNLDYEYDDPLYNEIVEFVVSSQKASASLLQRKFKLGYNRAARIIDLLEERGIIGPQNGSKPREVLVRLKND